MERTDDDNGYWLVAYDGGIFTFGDAKFYGSTGSMHLNQPVLGMERTASGKGYWLFARDGGVFTFGDAKFYGSAGSLHLTVAGRGDAAHARRTRLLDARPGRPGVRRSATRTSSATSRAARTTAAPTACSCRRRGKGYWIATADGSVIAFGDAKRLGFPVDDRRPARSP